MLTHGNMLLGTAWLYSSTGNCGSKRPKQRGAGQASNNKLPAINVGNLASSKVGKSFRCSRCVLVSTPGCKEPSLCWFNSSRTDTAKTAVHSGYVCPVSMCTCAP
eukprot:4342676-Amphidinium_carterae.1